MAKKETTATDLPLTTGFDVTAEEAAAFNLEPHLVSLMFDEPFYSKILRGVTKVRTESIPTAGVTVKDGDVKLYWNPYFLASLSSDEIKGLIIHEACHVIFEHCTNRRHDPFLIWNYSTDCAINSMIPENLLPDCGIIPGKPAKLWSKEEEEEFVDRHDEKALERTKNIQEFIANLPKNLASEEYFALWMQQEDIKEQLKKQEELNKLAEQLSESGLGGQDDHEGWDENLSEEDRELVKGKVRQALEDAVKECDSKGSWGSVPGEMRGHLREMISREIPWESVLKQFCGMTRRANRTTSRRRLNKKYPNIHSGTKRNYTASIAVYIDQSGSVGNNELEMLFGELTNLAKNIEFVTYHFDSEVDEDSETAWRPGRTPRAHRTRCGGTCFKVVAEHAMKNKHRFDGYLVLTDGYAPNPGPSRLRRGWVITPGGTTDHVSSNRRDFFIELKEPKTQQLAA